MIDQLAALQIGDPLPKVCDHCGDPARLVPVAELCVSCTLEVLPRFLAECIEDDEDPEKLMEQMAGAFYGALLEKYAAYL